jgi:putative nucleotidyltransferase with HDIG domain
VKPVEIAEAGAEAPTGVYHSRGRSTPHVKPTDHGDWRDLRMNLLSEIDKTVRSASGLADLDEHVSQMIRRALRCSTCAVLLLDESKKELLFELTNGKRHSPAEHIRLNAGSGIAGWVARNSRPLIINDIHKDRRFNKDIARLAGYPSKSVMCVPLIVRGKTIGVLEVLDKLNGSGFTGEDLEVLVAVGSIAGMAIDNTRLHRSVEEGYKGTIRALAAAVDAKDPYTCGHSRRVTEYALAAGKALSLPEEKLEALEYGATLHDIGKIGIPDSILAKPGPLRAEERKIVRQHPLIGASIIEGIPFLEETRRLVVHHHERYDGGGYPHGLQGEAMPVVTRLLTVADVFDTLTTNRSYRSAMGNREALDELVRCSGTQFCPVAVEAFIAAFRQDDRKSP